MSEQNVYRRLATARALLQKKSLKKSGKNAYAGFSYFELSDFIPAVNEIFANIGLCSHFRIAADENGVQIAILDIINADKPDEVIRFESCTADAQMKGASAIQQLGSVHTYMRRYLWLEAMEITECDAMDAVDQKTQVDTTPKKEKMISEAQMQKIGELFEGKDNRLVAMMNAYKINDLSELTAAQANAVIKRMSKEEA